MNDSLQKYVRCFYIFLGFFACCIEAQLHFASLGSWGTGSSTQYAVAKTLKSKVKEHQLSFVVSPGANFVNGIQNLEDKQWITAFEKPYGGTELHLPFFTVLGESDWEANYTAQVLRTNLTYTKGKEDNGVSMHIPQWTLPNYWYHYTIHFGDASGVSAAYGSSDVSAGFVFIDTFILSDKFPAQNITRLHWNQLRNTLEAAAKIFDWVIVIGDKTILSSGASKGDPYLSDTLRQLLKEYHVDAYVSGRDYDMEVLEDGTLLHINCGAGSHSDPLIRVKADQSVLYVAKPGFCHHTLTKEQFATEFIDAYTGSLIGNYTKQRNIRERSLLDRFHLYHDLPSITYIPVPSWTNIAPADDDLFIRICGTIGLIISTFVTILLSSTFGHRIVKLTR